MTRFFYLAPNENNSAQIFVLTENNILYSEYLRFGIPAEHTQETEYDKFDPRDFAWQNDQILVEIAEAHVHHVVLAGQENWVESYLMEQLKMQYKGGA